MAAERRAANAKVFVKQMGDAAYSGLVQLKTNKKRGRYPDEWPKDLRIRDFPQAQ